MRFISLGLAFLLAGCGVDGVAFDFAPPLAFDSPVSVVEPQSELEFMQQMTALGIRLTVKDLDEVTRYTVVKPSGQWTPGPMNNSDANLQEHFHKHGHELQPPAQSAREYLDRALSFASQPRVDRFFDSKYYKDRQFVSVVRWDRGSQEFGVVRLNGQMATYFLRDDAESGRFVKVPNEMWGATQQPMDLHHLMVRPRYRQAS